MLVTWPFVFLLLDAFVLERRPTVKDKVPFFALVAAVVGVTLYAQAVAGDATSQAPAGFGEQVATAVWGYAWYLAKTVLPFGLAVLHPLPGKAGGDPLTALEVGGAAVLLLAVSAGVWRSGSKPLRFGWLWYLGTLVPVIGFVRVGSAAVAERYHYVPSIGLFVGAVLFASERLEGWRWRKPVVDVSAAAVLGLAVLTWMQTATWANDVTLFSRVVERHPNSVVMQFNLASALFEEGRGEEALEHYRRVLELDPEKVQTRFNIGVVLHSLKRNLEAETELKALLAAQPSHVEGKVTLAQVLWALRRREEAERMLDEAIATAEQNGDAKLAAELRARRSQK
jgi:hypothetical protein